MRFRILAIAFAVTACAKPYFSGAMDLDRVDKGEVYLEEIRLDCNREMLREVFTVNAPPWRVLNVQRDIENYPLWDALIDGARVTSRDGDNVDAELMFVPFLGHRLAPLKQHIRIDAQRYEVSMTAYDSDWMHEGQIVEKLAPLDDGKRTLVTFFFQGRINIPGFTLLAHFADDRYAQTAKNLRHVALMPQYNSEQQAAGSQKPRVAVPNFASDGVSPDLARTVTRVFAEEMMRSGSWDVSTPQEINALLSYDRQQMLAGCVPPAPCGAELSKALGADRIVTGTVGKIGNRIVVSASLMKLTDGTVERRSSRDSPENGLLDGVRWTAADLARP